MKITPKALAPVAIVAAFGLGTLAPHAQTTPQKVGFVDTQKLLAAHPNGKEMQAIQQKADTELNDLGKQIQAIDAKGAQATAAEREKRTQLVATYQARQKTYTDQFQPKAAAAEKAVDTAISAVAKQNGYSIVMNRDVAAQGLVVYADSATDLTDAALKALKP